MNEMFEKLVAGILARKERLAELEAEHKLRVKPIREEVEKLEAALAKLMTDAGIKSAKTRYGTAYFSDVSSVKIVDWLAALDFIVQNGAWDLLERRINKTALKESGANVPGVAIEFTRKVNVRRT